MSSSTKKDEPLRKKIIPACLSVLLVICVCCNKKDAPAIGLPTEYFMSATIDSTDWKITTYGDVSFGTSYNYDKKRFSLGFGGQDQATGSICRLLTITFEFVPLPGRYYFNNVGSLNALDSSVMGIYVRNIGNYQVTKWSNSGYVDIDEITKENLKGKFSFTAVGDAQNPGVSTITAGSFNAFFSGSGGMDWNGP